MSSDTRAVIDAFNEAFNSRDVDAIMAHMTEDVVFENTAPPDGDRYEGAASVRAVWERFFSENPGAWFDTEDMVVADDRCVTQWRFTFDKNEPSKGSVRGADVFRVRDGKVAEKFSYVKG